MSPAHSSRKGIHYRYYVSAALNQGQAEQAGTVARVPATEVEQLILDAVRQRRRHSAADNEQALIAAHVERIDIRSDAIAVTLRHLNSDAEHDEDQASTVSDTIVIPWRKSSFPRPREIITPQDSSDRRPARAETNQKLIVSIACGRRWLDELLADPIASVESIAKREVCSERKVNMTISLAFLAPDLIKAAIEGRLPRGMGIARLCDMPAEWSRQHETLGLPQ